MPSKPDSSEACQAWELLLNFFFSQRAGLPVIAAEFQLSPAQCHVLRLMDPDKPVAMGQLAGVLSCDASNVTGLIDRLESRGLVRRLPSEQDRRVKVLALTSEGVRLRASVNRRITRPPINLDRLTAEEKKTLVRLLRRLME